MLKILLRFSLLPALIGLWSCEEEFIPDLNGEPAELVVEGYIEAGDRPTPPYVILTRSFPFSQKLGSDQLNGLFVRDAEVKVSDGEKEVALSEVCLQDLTSEQREQVAGFLGFDADSIGFNFCAYLDLTFSMVGEIGKTYQLTIDAEEKTLSATTSIPGLVSLDSLKFVEPPGEPVDTLLQLICYIRDPGGERNFYRYFTQINDGPLQPPLASVTDDLLFDGQSFEFPLAKAERDTAFDINTFGLYRRGDTVTIKWANLDEAHYNFWNTLEFNRANQGPFSSYTRVQSNVKGGLGIWGGISAAYYTRVAEE